MLVVESERSNVAETRAMDLDAKIVEPLDQRLATSSEYVNHFDGVLQCDTKICM